ncbi:MAG: GNAT family N-acetyltransferase [Halobacteria archaeon]|nr:GNAT family N-acetyltransferase [Halobacteria archaeon]
MLELREAEPSDVPTLEVIRQQSLERGFSQVDEYDRSVFSRLIEHDSDSLRDEIDSESSVVLVAETDLTPVCFGVLAESSESVRLDGLYTSPNHSNCGCASRILDEFEEIADDDGSITVDAPLNSVGFFESKGFEKVRDKQKDGIRVVRLEKDATSREDE